MSAPPRVPLYDRLPEIYRIRDEEQSPPGQLKAYLAAVEQVFSALHENIESLYHDFFIDTCDDWVIPYLADLVGASHLKGESRTLRADAADTIALRRRKGTLGAIERLAADLTGWPARCIELRENLAWTQHLNHQRPDRGGAPPSDDPHLNRFPVWRGGFLPVRDPARLSLLGTPFDTAAYLADTKIASGPAVRYNLPNLAIFIWRLKAHRLPFLRPLIKGVEIVATAGAAPFCVKFDLDPLDRPVRLFNTWRNKPTAAAARLTAPDEVPGPIPWARLTTEAEAGNPGDYVALDAFDPDNPAMGDIDVKGQGLNLFLPAALFADPPWRFRGDNLCGWSAGLGEPVQVHEMVIDPDLGRVLIGVASEAERDAIAPEVGGFARNVLAGYTYGAVDDVGAHPISRPPAPTSFQDVPVIAVTVDELGGSVSLSNALANREECGRPLLIEIQDSLVHDLDLTAIAGTSTNADGTVSLRLNSSLIIRAASGERPVIRLAQPLRFRPTHPAADSSKVLTVRFEGVMLMRGPGFVPTEPLIARAAVAAIEFLDCTLDPGGYGLRDKTRAQLAPAIRLEASLGFVDDVESDAYQVTPRILLQRTISGALLLGEQRYRLRLENTIVDAGVGPGEPTGLEFAVSAPASPDTLWGPPLEFSGVTVFGRVRVVQACGSGGIFTHRLEAHNNQTGCIKVSYFRGDADRLPQNPSCISGADARLAFTSEWFGDPGYAQISMASDPRLWNGGPGDDQMGAFAGLALESHKWANLRIRLREFMPIGVRPLMVPVT